MTKASFAILFVVGLVAVTNVWAESDEDLTNSSHNLIVGTRQTGDRLLSHRIIIKSSKWLRIVSEDITFHAPYYYTITQVKALDQKTNGNGAYASITNGGPGNREVTVHFESIRGHSIKFILEIYGRATTLDELFDNTR